MRTEKDCKYYSNKMCILATHPDCKGKCGIPTMDRVHVCEMEYPCFEDEK
jgi:hypothetical protein